MSFVRCEQLAEDVVVYQGDMRDVLPILKTFDACVTDPPYGINENHKKVASRGKVALPKNYGEFFWDSCPIGRVELDLIRNTSTWQIIFGGNYFELPPTSCWLVWDKQNSGDFADCELAWTNLPKAVRRIYWRWNGMIRKGSDVREHPTQKPVGVMEWCLEQLPSQSKSVCDPFMGAGTTGVACVKRGFSFVGIEREGAYFDIARRRISDALKSPDMITQAKLRTEQQGILL